MCGINGIISKNKQPSLASRIGKMNSLIYHRGPDDDGIYIDDNKVAFGMRRLSIIDLSNGKQPITNNEKTLVIVFNGEIYNYREIKQNLLAKGVTFNTSSDTEVILKLYEHYGVNCVNELNGMFAFSIYDKKKKEVFIARDRFGEKPIYFNKSNNEIIWASELKSIIKEKPELKKISQNSLHIFLSLSYIPAPYTIYEDIHKLEPGCSMVINIETLNFTIQRYWNIQSSDPNCRIKNYSEASKKLNNLLFDSIEKRMIADVPVGVFLSGGVDSTIIASAMSKISNQKIKTFTVSYKNRRYDESVRAAIIAKQINSEHFECLLNYDELIGDIDKVILNYDEPYADPSCLPTYFISRKTAQFVKVALTGDGGDEVFGGYNKYLLHTYGKLYQTFVPDFVSKHIIEPTLNKLAKKNVDSKSFLTRSKKLFDSLGSDTVNNHLSIIQLGFKEDSLAKLCTSLNIFDINKCLNGIIGPISDQFETSLKKARLIDTKISLEGDLLVKVDRASMLASLECRAPFLDHRIMEFSYSIPDKFLINGNNRKKILKDTFSYLLPNNFFKSPKVGFEIPIGEWFRNELKEEFVNKIIEDHLSTKVDNSWKIWTLYCFQKWYNQNFI